MRLWKRLRWLGSGSPGRVSWSTGVAGATFPTRVGSEGGDGGDSGGRRRRAAGGAAAGPGGRRRMMRPKAEEAAAADAGAEPEAQGGEAPKDQPKARGIRRRPRCWRWRAAPNPPPPAGGGESSAGSAWRRSRRRQRRLAPGLAAAGGGPGGPGAGGRGGPVVAAMGPGGPGPGGGRGWVQASAGDGRADGRMAEMQSRCGSGCRCRWHGPVACPVRRRRRPAAGAGNQVDDGPADFHSPEGPSRRS